MKQVLRVRFIELVNLACMPHRKTDTPLTNSEADIRLTDDGWVEVRALPGKQNASQVVTRVPREHCAYVWVACDSEPDVAPPKPASKPKA